jgi:micrococcal nuclease
MPFRKRRPGKRGNWYLPGFIVVSVLAAFFNPPDPGVTSGEFEYVQRVVDGDTLLLGTGERVRLIGVNTPETVHPKKAVEAFGKKASAFTKRMVEGRLVRLEFDPLSSRANDGKDRYSRTLAYVFLQDGTHLNAEIIRQGYGFAVSSTPPLKYQNEFRRLEREAREQRQWCKAHGSSAEVRILGCFVLHDLPAVISS